MTTKTIVDCATGEVNVVDMTQEEIAQMEAAQATWTAEQEAQKAAKIAKAEARASAEAKLAALGLTPEEIAEL
jgi:hypothetical protein